MTHSFDFIYSGRFIHSPRINLSEIKKKKKLAKKIKSSETREINFHNQIWSLSARQKKIKKDHLLLIHGSTNSKEKSFPKPHQFYCMQLKKTKGPFSCLELNP